MRELEVGSHAADNVLLKLLVNTLTVTISFVFFFVHFIKPSYGLLGGLEEPVLRARGREESAARCAREHCIASVSFELLCQVLALALI